MSRSNLRATVVVSVLSIASLSFPCLASFAQNAIAPDKTLPSNTLVNFNNVNKTYTITGGTQIGVNQFHSFQNFSVPTGNIAHFNTLPTTVNAISRVTGSNISNIDGLIKANGTTNLYLINPNGIVFGKDAKLEIGGSFGASTANSFKFPDGSEFSATNPQAPPLLNVNVPLGLQYGKSNTGATINNRGNLAVGQDLLLNTDKLDLQGSLQAGRDLTLQAQDLVKIRDTVTTPFWAVAGRDFLVQGNQGIDILALNHLDQISFVSNRNLSLVSNGIISGDAHFSTGGSFSIKSLSGNLANFTSLYDPIVSSVGDIDVVGNYSGVALLAESKGNIRFQGTVNITGKDTSFSAADPNSDKALLGSSAALIIRSRLSNLSFAATTLSTTIDGATFQAGSNLPSGITLQKDVTTEGGAVILQAETGDVSITNANLSTKGGNFAVTALNGKLTIAGGKVDTAQYPALASDPSVTGDIKIDANSVSLSNKAALDAPSLGKGNAGNITIKATDKVSLEDFSYMGSQVGRDTTGKGGNISITAKSLSLNNNSILASRSFGFGNAGDIAITATDSVSIINNSSLFTDIDHVAKGDFSGRIIISTGSLNLEQGSWISSGNQGNVDLGKFGNGGKIDINAISLVSLKDASFIKSEARNKDRGNGSGGDIKITVANGDLVMKNSGIYSDAERDRTDNRTTLYLNDLNNLLGNGGNIDIKARSILLTENSQLSARTFKKGISGNITLTATDAVQFSGNSQPFAPYLSLVGNSLFDALPLAGGVFAISEPEAIGTTGNINIIARSLSITDGAQIVNTAFGQGNAGNITLKITDVLSANNGYIFSDTGNIGLGNAGKIDIQTGSLSFANGAVFARTFRQGDAGNVKIVASDSVQFNILPQVIASGVFTSSEQGAIGNAGDISITARSLSLTDSFLFTDTFGKGNAGNITLKITDLLSAKNGYIFSDSISTGIGNAGRIDIQTGSLSFTDGAHIGSRIFTVGNAGVVNITATDSVLFSGKNLQSFPSAILASSENGSVGNAGEINISAKSLALNDGALISTSAIGQGNAGNITLKIANLLSAVNGNIYSDSVGISNGSAAKIDIQTGSLSFSDGGIFANTIKQGDAGNIAIAATGSVQFVGNPQPFTGGIYASVIPGGVGNAGNIDIKARSLSLTNGSALLTLSNGQGNAGNITIKTTDSVQVSGISPDPRFKSGIFANLEAGGTGKVGKITIDTGSLSVTNGAALQVNARDRSIDNITDKLVITARDSVIFSGVGGGEPSGAFSRVTTNGIGSAGNIVINTRSLAVTDGAQLNTSTSSSGNAGDIIINASDSVLFSGVNFGIPGLPFGLASRAFSTAEIGAIGDGGNIVVNTASLSVTDGAQLLIYTIGQGKAGNISINARDSVLFSGAGNGASSGVFPTELSGYTALFAGLSNFPSGIIASTVSDASTGGKVAINTNSLNITNSALIDSSTFSGKTGGSIEVNAQKLNLSNGGKLATTALNTGDAGSIKISLGQSLTLSGNDTLITARTFANSSGNGGDISVNTQLIDLQDRAIISASTSGSGKAGDISVKANNFALSNGASIQTATSNSGDSGKIDVKVANTITLTGEGTGLFANTLENSSGKGGDIFVDPQYVLLQDGAKIAVGSLGTGVGGNVTIFANNLTLRNGASITADTASTDGGNININIPALLFLRYGSQISTSAGTSQAGGNGGNININSEFIIGVREENSDIFANAFTGNGGNINISTNGIFGLNFRPKLTQFSDITASSQFGLQGIVNINTPGVDPSKGLNNLPSDVSDRSRLVRERCIADRRGSSFTITGKGGIAAKPSDRPTHSAALDNFGTLGDRPQTDNLTANNNSEPSAKPQAIVEATGWIVNDQNQVVLVAGKSPTPAKILCP